MHIGTGGRQEGPSAPPVRGLRPKSLSAPEIEARDRCGGSSGRPAAAGPSAPPVGGLQPDLRAIRTKAEDDSMFWRFDGDGVGNLGWL